MPQSTDLFEVPDPEGLDISELFEVARRLGVSPAEAVTREALIIRIRRMAHA